MKPITKPLTGEQLQKSLDKFNDKLHNLCTSGSYTDIDSINSDELYELVCKTVLETLEKLVRPRSVVLNMDYSDAEILQGNLQCILSAEEKEGNTETVRYRVLHKLATALETELVFVGRKKK